MLDHAIARAVVIVAIAGLIWVGIAFAAYALAMGLAPGMGVAGAAALTAVICLIGSLTWLVVRALSRPAQLAPPYNGAKAAQVDPQQAVLSALTAMAQDKPLLAVISAGLFGAADVILKERNK